MGSRRFGYCCTSCSDWHDRSAMTELSSHSDKKLFRDTTTDSGDPPAQREPWPARKMMVATVLAACCCAAVAMGSAGVTSHMRGFKDPTDVGAVDAGIFDDETPGRRLSIGCKKIKAMGRCNAREDCTWKRRGVCGKKKDKNR